MLQNASSSSSTMKNGWGVSGWMSTVVGGISTMLGAVIGGGEAATDKETESGEQKVAEEVSVGEEVSEGGGRDSAERLRREKEEKLAVEEWRREQKLEHKTKMFKLEKERRLREEAEAHDEERRRAREAAREQEEADAEAQRAKEAELTRLKHVSDAKWPSELQLRLNEALVLYPSDSWTKVERWTNISQYVGGKRTKRECAERFKMLREEFRAEEMRKKVEEQERIEELAGMTATERAKLARGEARKKEKRRRKLTAGSRRPGGGF